MTDHEKAERYDALVFAIKVAKDNYSQRRRDADARYKDASPIGAYNKGLSDGYGFILDDLGRWSE